LKVDSNPRACAIDPYFGAVATVCEAARNVACVGARPAGITNCLNYGNPERPEIMWQFVRGIEGLRDAARAFNTPVVSGNVSFYNETEGRAIPPTPVIAMIGIIEEVGQYLKQYFNSPGDAILMVRTARPSLAASEYSAIFGSGGEMLPSANLEQERRLIESLVDAAARRLIRSAHDVSEGGFAVALAEACFNPDAKIGADVTIGSTTPDDLFGEGPSTVILSAPRENLEALNEIFAPLECSLIGQVTSTPRLKIGSLIDEGIGDLVRFYEDALPWRLAQNDGKR
jgi:phosphoribosylformylglycinamidine synthase subunit PurL